MIVYVAAPYARREEAIVVMRWLEAKGHVVTSSWLRKQMNMSDAAACTDLDDVRRANVFLLLNLETSEGKNVELGYALALGKQIVLVGARTNVFHYLECVRVIASVDDL